MKFSNTYRNGLSFSPHEAKKKDPFETLFELFKEMLTHTSGDVDEALDWLEELDKTYQLTNDNYTLEDFVEDLKKKGYLQDDQKKKGGLSITAKTEKAIRKHALDQLFGKLKKSGRGQHRSNKIGSGSEFSGDFRSYVFGDDLDQINMNESIKNAYTAHGINDFTMDENDLVINQTHHLSQMSTVLMIDISHSMILYGEDRITPAKKVAMALAEFIKTRYPKDSLDIIVFGNDAWPIALKDLPYLEVGPYHTNTVAGLQLALDILRRKRLSNKQIFMITDGKPSCLKLPNGDYYKNSFGLDSDIVNRCYQMAKQARKLDVPITTFMIAKDSFLIDFIRNFTEANRGKAFYTGLKGLGEMIFEDYENNRIKKIR